MNKSQSILNIAKALEVFHVKVDKIKKDAKNPFFKSNYASLPNVLEAIRDPLAESGLVFTQHPDGEHLTTILIHVESGEFLESSYLVRPIPEYTKEKDKEGNVLFRSEYYITPQAIGSAITYARRYALSAILGLNIDDDDDGNDGSGRKEPQNDPAPTDARPWLNENTDMFKSAVAKLEAGTTTIDKIKSAFKVSKKTEAILLSHVKNNDGTH